MAASFPTLASITDAGKISVNVRLLKYSKKQYGTLLKLSGGFGPLIALSKSYRKETVKHFFSGGGRQPVIFIVDHDEAWNEFRSQLNPKALGAAFDPNCFLISHGVYVVRTPLSAGKSSSKIEDLFEDDMLKTKVDGKSFNAEKDVNPENEYGKVIFAHKVVVPKAGSTSFEGFRPLLSGIEAAIAHAGTA